MGLPPIQQPLIAQPQVPAFVSFSAEIVPKTIEALLATMANLVNQGFREIHLLLSTPGGSVMHGITVYNVLRGLPITLITHNVANVDSIGTVVFLAGQQRYACPQATFMLHGVALSVTSATNFFEKNLTERLASVRADQERIKAIYSDRAGINPNDAEQFFLGEVTMNAADAVKRGIVHEVREVQIPAGSPVLQLVFDRK
jgi:ATP-dependent Clp protease protease subunit